MCVCPRPFFSLDWVGDNPRSEGVGFVRWLRRSGSSRVWGFRGFGVFLVFLACFGAGFGVFLALLVGVLGAIAHI